MEYVGREEIVGSAHVGVCVCFKGPSQRCVDETKKGQAFLS